MTSENVISVKNVSKNFKLPHLRRNSLKSVFTGILEKSHNKSYEVQHALNDVSFDIKKGEFFGIVGRNGSGKSTLLKMLAGIYQPTKGTIRVEGKLVPFIELGVGFNTELTGRENVYLNGALLGFDRKAIESMYDDIVEFAELEKFMDQKLKNYSSGMQVRLAFSMAIRADADILLIDEVLAVGDADFQRKCFEYFKSLKRNKKTVVFVSHDMSAVREYCDRAILIEKSKLILEGSPAEVSKAYTKMFNDAENAGEDSNGLRWGNHIVQYGAISVAPKTLKDSDKELVISAQVESKEQIDDAVFGFSIKASDGQALMGTNTQIESGKVTSLVNGEKIQLQWVIPNIFNSGRYFIEPAIVYNGGSEVADWWEEAGSFDVRKAEKTPYAIRPTVELIINKDA